MRIDRLAVIRALFLVAMFAACYYLFYMQAIGVYDSDLGAHLAPPDETSYSAIRGVYQVILGFSGIPGVCVFLSLVEVGTIVLTEYVIRKLCPGMRPVFAFAFAVAINFAIAIYVPGVTKYFVVGSPGGNCWHNSTYTIMRLLALGALVFYLKFDGRIDAASKVRSWVLFTLMLTLATSVKPSFAMVFGPAMFVLCVVDLVRYGTPTVKRSLLIALSLVIALAVVVHQYLVLFPGDGSGEGVGFSLARVWRHFSRNIFVSFFLSLAFPFAVFAIQPKKIAEDRNYLLAWLMCFFAFAEYVFLHENGERMMHGNFGWGLTFAMFYLFIASVVVLYDTSGRSLKLVDPACAAEGLPSSVPSAPLGDAGAVAPGAEAPDGEAPGVAAPGGEAPVAGKRQVVLAWVALVLFGLHTISGVVYFVLKVPGVF